MSIASRIKSVRTDNGLSVRKFASMLDVSSPTISRLETGQRTPDVNLILRISETFKKDLVWLMTGGTADGSRVSVSLRQIPIFRELPPDLSKPPTDLIEDWLSLPDLPSSAAAIVCHDDSAAPIAKRGDLVVFVPGETAVGDLALLTDQWGEAKVRRVKDGHGGPIYYAENPEYRELDERAEFKAVGKMVKVVRTLA